MAHVFHVEFGINDTPLTRALENGNFASAERLILDCMNPSYLDEGCYQRIPLNICLCGVDQDAERVTARNLYLARLLIERGANINHRVPVTFYGSEFLSPGKSCLELLTDYYVDLTRRNGRYSHILNESLGNWGSAADVVVGLNKEYLQTVEDILENILDLIFIVLSNGGDPNIVDENRMTALHHICMYSEDIRLVKLLCDNGADLNAEDSHGNTPLLAVCDMATARMYDSNEDLSPCSEDSASSLCAPSSVSLHFLDFLILLKDVDINHQNQMGRTALFHCMVRGDVEGTAKLLRAGVNPSVKGSVWQTRKRKRDVSPLLAVFAGWQVQRKMMWTDPHECLTTAMQPFRHLVDAGYFSQPEIEEELLQLIDSLLPELWDVGQHRTRLLPLLFGGVTCSLQQLCARRVFRQCLVDSTHCLQRILPVSTFQQHFQPQELREREVYQEYMELVLNSTVLSALVSLLGLPTNALFCLQVELLLQQLGLKLSELHVERPDPSCPLVGDEHPASSSDSSVSEDGGDSDLEYW
ncbi:uncharacterized protein LOC143283073 [Babylonia areolata]|uniref:uncharacterized protein LOC143283073 n=1 Tax=Babylonia areolata TaxID=304850 RepID=UPI003FCF3C32